MELPRRPYFSVITRTSRGMTHVREIEVSLLVIPAERPAKAGRRAGIHTLALWGPDLRPAQGRASVRDDKCLVWDAALAAHPEPLLSLDIVRQCPRGEPEAGQGQEADGADGDEGIAQAFGDTVLGGETVADNAGGQRA